MQLKHLMQMKQMKQRKNIGNIKYKIKTVRCIWCNRSIWCKCSRCSRGKILGKIKNHIKEAYFKEQQLPTPIDINNSIFIVMKMKKDLTISIVNKAGIFPTSVSLSKKDINKLFGDNLLE